MKTVVLIGVCGRTASGKTSISKQICQKLTETGIPNGLLQMDDMYSELSDEDHKLALQGLYDFDQLSAFDLESLKTQLKRAKQGESVEYNDYDHSTHKHTTQIVQPPARVWVVEGLYLFADQTIAEMFDLKVFMDVDADTSLIRRIRRDCVERGRTVEGVLNQYEKYVKPAYERLVEPYRYRSDITVLRGIKNTAAFDTILHYIQAKILE